MPDDYLTRDDAATAIGVTPSTITIYIRRKWLDGYRLGGRWRIRRASLERLLHEGPPAEATSPSTPA